MPPNGSADPAEIALGADVDTKDLDTKDVSDAKDVVLSFASSCTGVALVEDGTLQASKASIASHKIPDRTKPFIIVVAVCAALGGLIFGFDIGGAGGTFVMTGFKEHFGWSCAPDAVDCVPATQKEINVDTGLINGLFGVGATIGAIVSTWIVESYGRKFGLYLASVVFILGAGMQGGAPNMGVMWAGRVIAGLAIGCLSMNVPVYISELAPEHVRGRLSALWQLAITGGILLASAVNLGLQYWIDGWRLSYCGNILFALILIVALTYMPESPRWLATKGRDDDVRAVLHKVRFEDEIDEEFAKLITEAAEETKMGIASWKEVVSKENKMRYRLLLGIGLQSAQQLCGINAIMFYAPNILKDFFGESGSITGSFILYSVNFLSTFICVYAIEKFGRVKLLVIGGCIMIAMLIIQSVLASLDQTAQIGYAVVVISSIFIVGFAFSWGPIVWVVCAEMFPLRARGKATGMTTMSNWFWTTVVGGVFPAASTASLTGCFGFFAGVITVGVIIVYLFQAETAEKTITEIDEVFADHKPKLKRTQWK